MASVAMLMSCDLPQGGNKRVLKQTDDVVQYSDPGAPVGTYKASADTAKAVQHVVAADSAKTVSKEVKTVEAAKPEHK